MVSVPVCHYILLGDAYMSDDCPLLQVCPALQPKNACLGLQVTLPLLSSPRLSGNGFRLPLIFSRRESFLDHSVHICYMLNVG